MYFLAVPVLNYLPHKLLTLAAMVVVRSVQVIDTGIDGRANHGHRLLFIDFAAGQRRQPHAAKAQQAYFYSSSAYDSPLHVITPFCLILTLLTLSLLPTKNRKSRGKGELCHWTRSEQHEQSSFPKHTRFFHRRTCNLCGDD